MYSNQTGKGVKMQAVFLMHVFVLTEAGASA